MSKKTRSFTEVAVKGIRSERKVLDASEFVIPAQLKPETKGAPGEDEIGGYDGPEPTRFGDWEHKGRTTDF
ncbi:DUF1674 domain-containing protein [Nisaea acidiphila]|uniref:DUF1674 domain-containing protein n=1 Tax=Nisaea acidiphila TaxID=1862145 RepID=A0A9J7AX29_9PROT|nr:DUF1674 domain-containing protein [Nisaea acidiphila]UUX50804.1 DUF1674 domain-containing protein [Nisaea acidiphila]